jgi:hypothetical protein
VARHAAEYSAISIEHGTPITASARRELGGTATAEQKLANVVRVEFVPSHDAEASRSGAVFGTNRTFILTWNPELWPTTRDEQAAYQRTWEDQPNEARAARPSTTNGARIPHTRLAGGRRRDARRGPPAHRDRDHVHADPPLLGRAGGRPMTNADGSQTLRPDQRTIAHAEGRLKRCGHGFGQEPTKSSRMSVPIVQCLAHARPFHDPSVQLARGNRLSPRVGPLAGGSRRAFVRCR